MTALVPIAVAGENLPGLIDRAASMLASAKTSADVLEAREAAGLAYDITKWRLADEYDAAQARGEAAKRGWESGVEKRNTTTAAHLGLRRDQIHDARLIRNAKTADEIGEVLS